MERPVGSVGVVRNRIGWQQHLSRIQGVPIRFDLSVYDAALNQINDFEASMGDLSDAQLGAQAADLRGSARSGVELETIRTRLFALAREASRRALGVRPFDVQIVAGLALDDGAIIEMQTGEGKTLAAVMPAALNALSGKGVHVLTFNDYLARRDAEWMGPVYRMLGLSVAHVDQHMTRSERHRAYRADVTYVTAKEAGFDHLRDLLATNVSELVHRDCHVAIVDEADSLMIDEARVPLVIAGRVEGAPTPAHRLAALIAPLTVGLHYTTDEFGRDAELTDAGIDLVEHALACGSLHAPENYALLTELNCALHAKVLLRRDVDYIVRHGRIELVDELTGRVVADRKWPDGLQVALEAKEGLESRGNGRILASMTLQCFLRKYACLAGMTGTAQDAASELSQVYGLDVIVIPTHEPMIRVDRPDVVFTHRDAKERAVVEEIRRVHGVGRPVLVGTSTVEESERLANRLRAAAVNCQVLNAKNDEEEAHIIARAGDIGAVTISTDMAGRGTDIRLGGAQEERKDTVAALGGLYVIGTNRHESRRVDLQLRGRAGRQGDPGESRFFVSLDDDLLVRFGLKALIPPRLVPSMTGDPVDHPVLRREIARAQRIIEGQNIDIRRTLSRYASVMEEQHASLMERRQALLRGEVMPDVWRGASERYDMLVAAAGEDAVRRGEVAVTLFHIDTAWREHLDFCATLREGIHLVRLGGQDPLQRFSKDAMEAFSRLEQAIDDAVLSSVDKVRVTGEDIDLAPLGLQAPSSTWTYLVNDDPFRNQMGATLTGVGGVTVAIYSSVVLMPLLLLWGIVDRFVKKRR